MGTISPDLDDLDDRYKHYLHNTFTLFKGERKGSLRRPSVVARIILKRNVTEMECMGVDCIQLANCSGDRLL
jgi:hypothetical protein